LLGRGSLRYCGKRPLPDEATHVTETERIRQFVRDEVLFDLGGAPVADETDLLDGKMDSLGLMRLVAFLEDEFDVEIDDVEINQENFRTVVDIARLVERSRKP
jgi:acyl carrier protein